MDPYYYMDSSSQPTNFTALLHSQVEPQTPEFNTQFSEEPQPEEDIPEGRQSRRKWSPTEDIVLCSAWLNTSKDAVVGNEQRLFAFWKRIAAYFNASPKLAAYPNREAINCKQRWQKINEKVCKFVGCYATATRQQTSGQNEDDVLKMAYQIYEQDHDIKFNLAHAWLELRNDQKWCAYVNKGDGSSKKRKLKDQSSSSKTVPVMDDEAMGRPEGVKAAKAKAKATASKSASMNSETVSLSEYQSVWAIKQQDLALKQTYKNATLLEKLMSKTEPLDEMEITLKKKLMAHLIDNV